MQITASLSIRLISKTTVTLLAGSLTVLAQAQEFYVLPTLYVGGQETANLQPVATYETPVSNLEFDPRLDLQARGMTEAQADVSIRGGIFENTGFRVGAATLVDPQTGHYSAELPIAPEMLQGPEVLTGVYNGLLGFNSSIGTVSYGWTQIQDGGSVTVGAGDHNLNFQRIHQGLSGRFSEASNWSWGVEAEISRSESDGTIRYGDHDFDRTTGRVQLVSPNTQTDFFAGYQSKFFGWPELYAAPFGSNETENLKTRLFLINHQLRYAVESSLEVTAYSRRHSDHYIFNRFSPNKTFVHETKAHVLAAAGRHVLSEKWALNYAGQFTADEIESTQLENSFTSRSYYKLSLLPEYGIDLNAEEHLSIKAGLSYDNTNRNEADYSPLAEISWSRSHASGSSERLYLSYSQATQVAGYTAIGGSTGGLFASDPDLQRERSENLEFGVALDRRDWSLEAAVFYRWDDDLVDWTYSAASPNARSANNVDIETFGIELIGTRRWGALESIASYAYLHKDADYGAANIDASFYALNFPEHRATLGFIWQLCPQVEIRIDNEWRSQETNSLREGSDQGFFTHAGLSYFPEQVESLELFMAVDNAWDDDFQDVPGTPGRGDQYSCGVTYRW